MGFSKQCRRRTMFASPKNLLALKKNTNFLTGKHKEHLVQKKDPMDVKRYFLKNRTFTFLE